MPSPGIHERKTEPIIRTSSEFFPSLAQAEFDEVWDWAEAAVSTQGDILSADQPRPAILDRLGFSAARVFAAVIWLKGTLSAKRGESAVAP